MNVKAVAVSAGYWLIGAVTAVVLFCGFVVAYDASMNPQEDSTDILLNCHVYGDGDCGPNAPLHGFINV